jgi:hypothetical protein
MVAQLYMLDLPQPSFEKIYSLGPVQQKDILLAGLLFPYRSTIFLVCVFLFLMSRRAQTLAAHSRILCPSRPLYLESTACTTFFFFIILLENLRGWDMSDVKKCHLFFNQKKKSNMHLSSFGALQKP